MTEEKIKAFEKDILQVANDGAPCLLCENSFCDFRCEESDYNCVRCKLSGECKCAGCICNMHFELRKDYGLADEAPSAEDESGGWIKPEKRMPEEDECVLVIVSGVFGNITFKNAVELAEYSSKEGWILESFPEYENPIIKWWRAIPKPPKGE